jgi:hypothetical protein
MLFEWSAECSADDPVLVVPWSSGPSDPANAARFVDLREDPYAIDEIPEAEAHPPLLNALRALNGPRSPLFTAKCDVWSTEDQTDLDPLRLEFDLPPEIARIGLFSYIDLLWRDRSIFTSFHQHEHLVDRLARRAEALNHPLAMLDCIIRPAFLDLSGPQQGFAITLYVKALGLDLASATATWSSALESAVALLRSRDLTPNT